MTKYNNFLTITCEGLPLQPVKTDWCEKVQKHQFSDIWQIWNFDWCIIHCNFMKYCIPLKQPFVLNLPTRSALIFNWLSVDMGIYNIWQRRNITNQYMHQASISTGIFIFTGLTIKLTNFPQLYINQFTILRLSKMHFFLFYNVYLYSL